MAKNESAPTAAVAASSVPTTVSDVSLVLTGVKMECIAEVRWKGDKSPGPDGRETFVYPSRKYRLVVDYSGKSLKDVLDKTVKTDNISFQRVLRDRDEAEFNALLTPPPGEMMPTFEVAADEVGSKRALGEPRSDEAKAAKVTGLWASLPPELQQQLFQQMLAQMGGAGINKSE